MTLSLAVDLLLSVLLVATLAYCAVLERRLTALRKSQDSLKTLIGELNGAIAAAGSSMRLLKSTAAGAAETLEARTSQARSLIDELSLLTASGERIAARIEQGAVQPPAARKPASGVLPAAASRLEAARPRIVRAEAPRTEALRNVR